MDRSKAVLLFLLGAMSMLLLGMYENGEILVPANGYGTGAVGGTNVQGVFWPFGAGNFVQVDAGTLNVGTVQSSTLKSLSGTRFICVDSSGNFTTSTTACSGT